MMTAFLVLLAVLLACWLLGKSSQEAARERAAAANNSYFHGEELYPEEDEDEEIEDLQEDFDAVREQLENLADKFAPLAVARIFGYPDGELEVETTSKEGIFYLKIHAAAKKHFNEGMEKMEAGGKGGDPVRMLRKALREGYEEACAELGDENPLSPEQLAIYKKLLKNPDAVEDPSKLDFEEVQ